MKQSREPLDSLVQERLALIRPVPARDPAGAARRRASFLEEAQSLNPAVSDSPLRRHKGWISSAKLIFRTKERSPMLATLASILLVVSILLGGTGITVLAAQDSLPDQPLYDLKTFSEDLRIRLLADQQSQLDLDLEFTARRVQELITLSRAGEAPPEAVFTRLQTHLNHALEHAAGLEQNRFPAALQKLQQALQTQEQKLGRAQAQTPSSSQSHLTRAREMVQIRLRLVEEGLKNPSILQERLRNQEQLHLRAETGTATGAQHRGPEQTGPGAGTGPGPYVTGTPTLGGNYGPGPGPVSTSNGGSRVGPGPYVTGTPTPGSDYGPGPILEPTKASGDGYGPGPQSTQSPCYQCGPGPHATEGQGGPDGPGPHPTDDPADINEPAPEEDNTAGPGNGGGYGGKP